MRIYIHCMSFSKFKRCKNSLLIIQGDYNFLTGGKYKSEKGVLKPTTSTNEQKPKFLTASGDESRVVMFVSRYLPKKSM